MKLSDIKQGQTLYIVAAFPELKSASINVLRVASKVFKFTNSIDKVITYYSDNNNAIILFDIGFMTDRKGYHKVFTSKKKAERYAELIREGCDVSGMFEGRAFKKEYERIYVNMCVHGKKTIQAFNTSLINSKDTKCLYRPVYLQERKLYSKKIFI